ncbi:hypothetical protein EDC94DRAFT_510420 [Helicostylum pulchrum]|nr:hypothetical protein EDC94DRAFT_510420 [Helicostylum pulchrum]
MECTHSRDSESLVPTFRRGASSSTIDYIFASPILAQQLIESTIEFINSGWTDHAALSVTFKCISSRQGTGMWRANPQLLRNPYFISSLKQKIESFFLEDSTSLLSNQKTWDAIKLIIETTAQSISRHKRSWQQRSLKRLQKNETPFFDHTN